MAALAIMTMGKVNEARQKVYPLFQKPNQTCHASASDVPTKKPSQDTKNNEAPRNRKSRKIKGGEDVFPSSNNPEEVQADMLDLDPNENRGKRRRTASLECDTSLGLPGNVEVLEISLLRQKKRGRPSQVEQTPSIQLVASKKRGRPSKAQPTNVVENGPNSSGLKESQSILAVSEMPNEDVVASTANPAQLHSIIGATGTTQNRPKKILRWNPKTGTIGSPPPKSAKTSDNLGRKTSTRKGPLVPDSRVVIIRYGHLPSQVGSQIDRILAQNNPSHSRSGKRESDVLTTNTVTAAETKTSQSKTTEKSTDAPRQPPKALHPLFTGKSTSRPAEIKEDGKDLANAVTNSSTNRPAVRGSGTQSYNLSSSLLKKTNATAFTSFGTSNGILRFPGAVEPLWPCRGIVHVRGSGDDHCMRPDACEEVAHTQSKSKKSKYQAVDIMDHESVITILSSDLEISNVLSTINDIDPDEFPPVPNCLRLPVKHYESGTALQQRVRKELHFKPPCSPSMRSSSEDELQDIVTTPKQSHPVLTRVYKSIASSLSAFDQGQCEGDVWTKKYSPKCASEVLQEGREAIILKDWLTSLTVRSVETGGGLPTAQPVSKSEGDGKRKRKPKKLDDFIVSTDEEANDMDEITDPEDEASSLGGTLLQKRTVVRVGDMSGRGGKDTARLTNTIVISGPHGCGKSAAVYAAAKELDFEVFEINSASRRSGKDIMEKVGNMTRNHLVQHSHISDVVEEDKLRVDQALEDDLRSGRQGTMNSFFKPKSSNKRTPNVAASIQIPKGPESKKPNTQAKFSLKQQKQQKQSLILIEEADIIYEEDKMFWATILSLVAQSKRPIIITCNDEMAVPIASLSLHAILRFNPPPLDLAVDYMLLVAACEGHIIRRDAVATLYKTRGLDLRASLMDLNFWCQFAVGDTKSGLDWFYPLRRVGTDVDLSRETIRVVSEGTYDTGMGCFSQDIVESHSHYLDIEEELLHQTWDNFNLDASDWHSSVGLNEWASKIKHLSGKQKNSPSTLSMYDDFADSMSAAEFCSGTAFASSNHLAIDTNLPRLSAKAREDYIQAHEILEATPEVDFDGFTKDISLWIKSRARKYLHEDQHIQHDFEIQPELSSPNESRLIELVAAQKSSSETTLCRRDFSLAFDPISGAEKPYLWTTTSLEASSFDRTLSMIVLDLAPYVRSIVAYDARLQQDRARLSNLLSEGGRRSKKMRTTRTAMSALEGGTRKSTRKDRYFGSSLNLNLVFHTGIALWLDAALAEEKACRPKDLYGKSFTTEMNDLMGNDQLGGDISNCNKPKRKLTNGRPPPIQGEGDSDVASA
ncbi:hypothetical protein BJ875DRAFT_394160 [Amylocarpus encephaloides]|uniref:ATPase AAA-type core domain-containing protein n=1 Tax=Amylocarpus encephaloides TaxID=45428 RepID=A0A9P8C8Q7_9HELO|nr:hypothetical protein BJ875DRAFT_394160 [Amylocarpus encephaloides]